MRKRRSSSERILIEEITQAALKLKAASRGLTIGAMIKLIRSQLGMSQMTLAKRAGVPQSTVTRIESGKSEPNLSTLHKILGAISCNLLIAPLLENPIETIRRFQARKVAEKHIEYLKGTMNLEDQQPDPLFINELLKQEEEQLLQGPDTKLWED